MATILLLRGLFGNQDFSGGLLGPLLRGLLPAAGGVAGGGGWADPGTGTWVANANGNAFRGGNIIPFARGGIVSSPVLFPMARGAGLMGEAGPEAIMPLSRGPDGRLGVTASNDNRGGGLAPVVIVENHGSGTQVEERSERRPDGRWMTRVILSTVKDGMASGEFDGAQRGRYAVLPRAAFR
jgi:phage-related minor tail protein